MVLYAVVRTLTGHRSNCISVDFHPFGEFFASGSLDTNLKIWDIRKKGCIHTYKGHTRGVNAIRFTPDGRWVVSGGEDNTVKVRTALLLVQGFLRNLTSTEKSKLFMSLRMERKVPSPPPSMIYRDTCKETYLNAFFNWVHIVYASMCYATGGYGTRQWLRPYDFLQMVVFTDFCSFGFSC